MINLNIPLNGRNAKAANFTKVEIADNQILSFETIANSSTPLWKERKIHFWKYYMKKQRP